MKSVRVEEVLACGAISVVAIGYRFVRSFLRPEKRGASHLRDGFVGQDDVCGQLLLLLTMPMVVITLVPSRDGGVS